MNNDMKIYGKVDVKFIRLARNTLWQNQCPIPFLGDINTGHRAAQLIHTPDLFPNGNATSPLYKCDTPSSSQKKWKEDLDK